MAPTHKKSGSDPDNKRGRRILGCFGFGSKIIKKDSANPDEKVVQKWGDSTFKVVQLSDHPVAKLLLIDHESQEKKDGIGKLMKQLDQVSKNNYNAKFESQSRLEGPKSNQMHESNGKVVELERGNLDSQKNCRKRKERGGSRRSKLEGDAIAAMSILMVILIIMLLCGRLCAIVCASICFYCLPRIIKTTNNNNKRNNDLNAEKHENSWFDSEAYRRKVVLQGILARKDNKMDVGVS
ncbi:hypothetical protein V2J09_018901 [Rumex salicifolius]